MGQQTQSLQVREDAAHGRAAHAERVVLDQRTRTDGCRRGYVFVDDSPQIASERRSSEPMVRRGRRAILAPFPADLNDRGGERRRARLLPRGLSIRDRLPIPDSARFRRLLALSLCEC